MIKELGNLNQAIIEKKVKRKSANTTQSRIISYEKVGAMEINLRPKNVD